MNKVVYLLFYEHVDFQNVVQENTCRRYHTTT